MKQGKRQMLQSKVKEIEAALAAWIIEQRILEPGESVVFLFVVDTLPEVVVRGGLTARRVSSSKLGLRDLHTITPCEVYDAAKCVRKQTGRCTIALVQSELKVRGLASLLAWAPTGNVFRRAYFAAKHNQTFSEETKT